MKLEITLAKMAFSGQKKVRILRQIERLTLAGVPIPRTMDMLHDLYSNKGKNPGASLAIAIAEWRKKIKQGSSIARSMRGWLSPAEEMIVEAGEQGGRLSTAFSDALDATRVSREIRGAVIGGVIYPVALLSVLVAALFGFATEIVPTFETILPADRWTGNARVMYDVAGFVTSYLAIVLASLLAVSVSAFMSLPYLTGPARIILEHIPPYSIYKVVQGASFMLAMRGFIAAGIAIPDGLRRISLNANPYLKERTAKILSQVNLGKNLGDAMRATGHHFPDPAINGEISIYAGLDNFDASLDVLAREWINGTIDKAKSASKIMSNVMLVALALTIGYMAASMFELQDIITQNAR